MYRHTSRPSRLTLLALLLAALAGCGDSVKKYQGYAFGAPVEISIHGVGDQRADDATGEVLAEFDRLQKMLHVTNPGELVKLNSALARGEPATVSPELARIVRAAADLSEKSGYRFAPSTGMLSALWGFYADAPPPVEPAATNIDALVKANPRMADITIEGDRIASVNRAVHLDFDGYVRGYALDRARAILKARGVKSALVSIGGDITTLGERGTRPWKVGIQHPRKEGPIAVVELYDGEALATSVDYVRYFELAGKRYCNVIDPATGYPVQGVEAAVVIARAGEESGALADATARAIFVAGFAGWRDTAQRMATDSALLIDGKGEVHVTGTLARRIDLKLPRPVVHETP